MSGQSRQRMTRGALAVALCVGVAAVALGAGYRSSSAVLTDDSAYLQKNHTVAHVNATSGRSDAQAAKEMATGSQRLEVVQVSPGVVYVVNNDTGQVYRLPTDSLTPQPVESKPASKGKLHVVTGHQQTYLVDGGHGTVTYLPGSAGGKRVEVPVPHHVDKVVVDGTGVAWGLSVSAAQLYRIQRGNVVQTIGLGGSGPALLTLAADHPVVYRPAKGTVAEYGTRGLSRRLQIPPEPLAVLAAPGADANVAVIAEPRTGEVVAVDFARDSADMVALPGRAGSRFGPPVVLNGRAYVPDYKTHQVVIVTLHPLRLQGYTPVPGSSDPFDLFVRDSRVWANDGYAPNMITFDRNGHQSTVDKGSGDTVHNASPDQSSGDAPNDSTARSDPAPDSARPDPGRSAGPRPGSAPPSTGKPTPKRVRMPQVVGLDKGRACQLVAAAGFTRDCALIAKPDRNGATGQVLSSKPAAGDTVSADSTVTIFYRGPYEVPDLTGMPVQTACDTLASLRLTCTRQVGGLADNAAGLNAVDGQQPAPHARVATGTRITVQYPTQIKVPDVVPQPNLDQATACAQITNAGLACNPQSKGACQPAGAVIEQNPPAGSAADPNAPITIGACLPNVTVPNLANLDPGAACQALQQAQLACAPNASEASRVPNQVHSQTVPPGTVVPATTQVGYVYAGDTPTDLTRWKMRDDSVPHHAEFLAAATGPAAPANWAPQSSPGQVYPVGAAQIAGLMPVYAYLCTGGCAESGSYFFGRTSTGAGAGYQLQSEVFRCFANQVAGTVPLQEMFLLWSYRNSSGATVHVRDWVMAVRGSYEYNYFLNVSGGSFVQDNTLCYVWPPA